LLTRDYVTGSDQGGLMAAGAVKHFSRKLKPVFYSLISLILLFFFMITRGDPFIRPVGKPVYPVFVFTLYYVGTAGNLVYAQTMALSTLIMAQLLHVFECRSEYYNVWESRLERNLLLVGAVFVSFSLMLCIIYLPFLSAVFQTVPLKLSDWLIVFCASIFPYAVSFAYRFVIKSAVRAFWAGEK